MTTGPQRVHSRDNPSLVQVRRALRDPGAYRRPGALLWLEGDHLLRACLARDWPLQQVLVAESAWSQPELQALAQRAARVLLLPDALHKELSTLDSPAPIGALIERPRTTGRCSAPTSTAPTSSTTRARSATRIG